MSKLQSYPNIPYGAAGKGIVVEQFRLYDLANLEGQVPAIIDTTREAYRQSLEQHAGGQLPDGTIDSVYTPENKRESTLGRIKSALSHRTAGMGSIFIVRSPDVPGQIDAFASSYPVEPVMQEFDIDRFDMDITYIQDLVARRPGNGVGAVALHSLLRCGGKYTEIQLDTFTGGPAADWYEKIGFERRGQSYGLPIGDHVYPTTRYIAESAGLVIENLEARNPALVQA